MFHVKVQTTRISIRDNFIEISLGSARSLSEEVLVRIKVRETFDHFASPTLDSVHSYFKTAERALVSHSLLIRSGPPLVPWGGSVWWHSGLGWTHISDSAQGEWNSKDGLVRQSLGKSGLRWMHLSGFCGTHAIFLSVLTLRSAVGVYHLVFGNVSL